MVKNIINIVTIIIGSIIIGCAMNLFLVPHHLLSGGISGLALIAGYFTPFSVSAVYFGLNLPLLVAGWFIVGRRFIIFSMTSVLTVTLAVQFIPVKMIASDPLLSALYAGILIGLGAGFSFKAGGSSGGFDILGAIISRYRDIPIGNIIIALNAVVVLAIGYIRNDWNIALASAVCIYVTGKVLNFIHTEHEKVTVYIVTQRIPEMTDALFKLHMRGITRIDASGAYSGEERDMLMTVVTRYELVEVKNTIIKTDPAAFVNISQTLEVLGNFRKRIA